MLTGAQFVLICGLAALGVAVGLVVFEVFTAAGGRWGSDDDGGGEPRHPAPNLPLAPKRLPECLIPKLQPMLRVNARQLEDA